MVLENCISQVAGGYQVKVPGSPAIICGTEEAAKAKLNELIQKAYSQHITVGENGGYYVKYGKNPSKAFSNQSDAIAYLNKTMSQPTTNTIATGVNALENGEYEVKLKGQPMRKFSNEADAVKFYNNLVNKQLATISEDADGIFNVKGIDGINRKFSTKEQAEQFLKKDLGIKDVQPKNPTELIKDKKGKGGKGFFNKIGSYISKTWKSGAKGKVALIAGALTGLAAIGLAVFAGTRKSKAEEVQPEETTVTATPVADESENPTPSTAAPEETATPTKPAVPKFSTDLIDETGNYTVQSGEGEYAIAENLLKEYNKTHSDVPVSQQNIAILAKAIMDERSATLGYASNPTKRISLPMLHPGNTVHIPNLENIDFKKNKPLDLAA